MTDLNLWRLNYAGVAFDFGTYDTGHPLTQQVAIAPGDLLTDDMAHPFSDGIVFGADRSAGMMLAFAGAHLDTSRPATRQWVPRLDAGQPFASAWAARTHRRTPGWVASLTNVDRGRMVYGRPRGYQQGLANVRRGWLEWAAGFAAADDKFYSATLSSLTVQVLTGAVASGSDAVLYPGDPDLLFPADGGARSGGTFTLTNNGTENTWPVVTFTGGKNPRLRMKDDLGNVVWALDVSTKLGDTGTFTIDTRPWTRDVRHNGKSRPGQLSGDPLAACSLPPGTHTFTFSADNSGGESTLDVEWRDAFASL